MCSCRRNKAANHRLPTLRNQSAIWRRSNSLGLDGTRLYIPGDLDGDGADFFKNQWTITRNMIRNREPIRIICCLLFIERIRRYGS